LSLLEIVIEEKQLTVVEDGRDNQRLAVRAERSFLRMAFLNVVHNAVKFSPGGSTLRISYTCQMAGASEVARVCVQDAGPGIATGEHTKVLERFFTSRNPDTAKQSGAGLGLSIAKLAVERSGGKLFFETSAPIGACCCIELPIKAE
jgi:signal transduction histidine kinase